MHKMQQNNVALKRPGEKLASASNASENTTMAKAQEKILILTLKHAHNRHKKPRAARQRDGRGAEADIIHI